MRTWFLVLACLLSSTVMAARPYDESADAKAGLQAALGAPDGLPVLVIFGANWCEDCRALARAMAADPLAKKLAAAFHVVKIDVGNFNKNLDIVASYGNPIKKGIPAAALLSANGKLVYATHAGELADARRMSEAGISDFFRQLADKTAIK
jgi:thioredoxin 1